MYWASSLGLLAVGIVLIILPVFAALFVFRDSPTYARRGFQSLSFGILMFGIALVIMLFALLTGTCSRQ